MGGRKSKINRNSMFYSEKDYQFDMEIGMDYIAQDMNQTITLFQVDRVRTDSLDIYGESTDEKAISYKEPVELNVVYLVDEALNSSYDKTQNLARYLLTGNLSFGVYEKTLTDNKVDISYGDYIGIQVTPEQMEYWVVTNDGRINFDNKHSMFGYKPLYRTVKCTAVDKNEFNGI